MNRRRLLSMILTAAMVFSMLPALTLTAEAAVFSENFDSYPPQESAQTNNPSLSLSNGFTYSTDSIGDALHLDTIAETTGSLISMGSGNALSSNWYGSNTGTYFQFQSTDPSNNFKLESYEAEVFTHGSGMSEVYAIAGYNGSTQVAAAIVNFASSGTYGSGDSTIVYDRQTISAEEGWSNAGKLTFTGSDWCNIDQVRMAVADSSPNIILGVVIDNIDISAPIIPNTAPTLTNISTLTGATEDTPYTITYDALKNASNAADDDGDPISFRVESVTSGILTKNSTGVTPGTTTLATGENLVWTPDINANGVLNAFTVKAYDGTDASATAVQVKVDVAAVNDAPVGKPSISGTAAVGQTLTASIDAISDVDGLGTFSYQWQVSDNGSTGWANISSGSTGTTYTVTSAEAGKYVRAAVFYTDGGGTAEAVYSDAFGPNKTSQSALTYGDVTKVYGDAAFLHTAAGGSGTGTVTYSSSDPSVAAIDNSGNVILYKAGSTTLTATKAGDAIYTDASKSCTLTVNQAVLTATVDDYSKTYGDTNPAFTVAVSGFVNSDTAATASGYAAPAASCAASTATGVGTAQITISGGAAANYTFNTSDTGTLTISPKSLSLGSVVANGKPYDGNTNGSGTIALLGVINGDAVTAAGTFTFVDKMVQTGKTVNVTGIMLGGVAKDNYTLAAASATAAADIIAKPVAISAVAIADKPYDGTATAQISAASLVDAIVGDDVAVDFSSAAASFDSEAVGNAKPVSVTGLSLKGADKNNYALASSLFNTTGNIVYAGTVLTPTASVISGEVAPGTSVTLTSATNGATIYYTMDGSEPTSGSTPYSGPITIGSSTTIKAIAVKAGMNNSSVMSASYTIVVVEQFSLAPGGTYYFDLSGQSVPGTVSPFLPDSSLKWVPFTYAGTVNAYSLDASANGVGTASASAVPSDRSLFVANWNITRETVSWNDLNSASLIFGKPYQSGGVSYLLRSLSVGNWNNGKLYDSEEFRGTPENNEWDQIINKNAGYIKKWSGIFSWGQDTTPNPIYRQQRGYWTQRSDFSDTPVNQALSIGFRPVLQITSATSTVLKTVIYDMGGNGVIGTKGASGTDLTSATAIYTGTLTLPEITSTNGFTYNGTGTGILGWYSGSTFYEPGNAPILPSGTTLTPGYGTAPAITTAALPSGTLGTAYSQALTATGSMPITWTIDSGSLPGGLTLTGDTISGTPSAAGAFSFTVKASNGIGSDTKALSITVSSASTTGRSDRGTSASQTGGAPVIVNGESQTAGTVQTTITPDGRPATTVTVDSNRLEAILASHQGGAGVIIPVPGTASVAAGVLTGEMVRDMENRDATLTLQTGSASYTLPASEISIEAVSQQLGANISLRDIAVTVGIAAPPAPTVTMIENTLRSGGYTPVAPPMDFTVSCSYGGRTVEVGRFNGYVERTVAIPDGVDPSKITTGIVMNSDGTFRHVPTSVTVIDGKYYARINSLTNSIYAVVWNPVEFSDAANHWAKSAINNMGSRMVVSGVGGSRYEPNRNMTRAEFAAVMVRALGIAPQAGESGFSDVAASAWHSKYIKAASDYGIIKGYTNGSFGAKDTITREQAMAMLSRAMEITDLDAGLTGGESVKLIAAYRDGAAVSGYAKDSVAACIKTGVASGKGNQMLAPKEHITRAEVAAMVERLLKKSGLI